MSPTLAFITASILAWNSNTEHWERKEGRETQRLHQQGLGVQLMLLKQQHPQIHNPRARAGKGHLRLCASAVCPLPTCLPAPGC